MVLIFSHIHVLFNMNIQGNTMKQEYCVWILWHCISQWGLICVTGMLTTYFHMPPITRKFRGGDQRVPEIKREKQYNIATVITTEVSPITYNPVDCSFNSLFKLTINETPQLLITCPLCLCVWWWWWWWYLSVTGGLSLWTSNEHVMGSSDLRPYKEIFSKFQFVAYKAWHGDQQNTSRTVQELMSYT